MTAVLIKNPESFLLWAKSRNIKKNRENYFEDPEGKIYLPIFNEFETYGRRFKEIEIIEEFGEINNREELKHIILNRIY